MPYDESGNWYPENVQPDDSAQGYRDSRDNEKALQTPNSRPSNPADWNAVDAANNPKAANDAMNTRAMGDPNYNTRDAVINRDAGSWEAQLKQLGGSIYDPTDLEGVIRQVSYAQNAGTDPQKWIDQQKAIYAERNRPTASNGGLGGDADVDRNGVIDAGWSKLLGPEGRNTVRYGDTGNNSGLASPANAGWGPQQAAALNAFYSQGRLRPNQSFTGSFAGSNPSFSGVFNGGGTSVPGQFTDPIAGPLEGFAQTRAQERENPSANSGQGLLESALRSISSQYQAGGYTPQQLELLNTQAIEPLEQMRASRKRQVMTSLSQRGIDPMSGVGQQMLGDVDRQFDQVVAQQRRALANQATQEQQSRQMQAVNLLNQLATGENSRLNEAYNYRTVPMALDDRAFNRASGLYNSAGNPLSVIPMLAQLANSQQAQQNGTGEALGYLAYLLANGGK